MHDVRSIFQAKNEYSIATITRRIMKSDGTGLDDYEVLDNNVTELSFVIIESMNSLRYSNSSEEGSSYQLENDSVANRSLISSASSESV